MKKHVLIIQDFFHVALGTWIILVVLELSNSGMVHRLINLEYYLYALILVYLIYRWMKN
ncbi:hypothetical protein HON36_05470 [Candidatus Parcubacteria bacterium]|jgi:hypothetical protein|nr:hypothetical protein [Candidatus Parcubacteria bacterium]MBT7228693.1 hypothetical protein [Candidatus Parcubacteria bacterium]